MELRCRSKILHGIIADGFLDVSCKSGWCGKRNGVVVIHRFSLLTGELISTRKFAEPRKGGPSGNPDQSDAVRLA
jgi:hypothetical protein